MSSSSAAPITSHPSILLSASSRLSARPRNEKIPRSTCYIARRGAKMRRDAAFNNFIAFCSIECVFARLRVRRQFLSRAFLLRRQFLSVEREFVASGFRCVSRMIDAPVRLFDARLAFSIDSPIEFRRPLSKTCIATRGVAA